MQQEKQKKRKSNALLWSAKEKLDNGNVQQVERMVYQQDDLMDAHRMIILNLIQSFYEAKEIPKVTKAKSAKQKTESKAAKQEPNAVKAKADPKTTKSAKPKAEPKAAKPEPNAVKAKAAPKTTKSAKPKDAVKAKAAPKTTKSAKAKAEPKAVKQEPKAKAAPKTAKSAKPKTESKAAKHEPNAVISSILRQEFQKQTQQRQKLKNASQIIGNALETDFKIKNITPNGSCMFSSFAFYLKKSAAQLRKEAVEMVSAQWERFGGLHEDGYQNVEEYIKKMSKRSTYGDAPELLVLAESYNLCVIVVNEDDDNISVINSSAPNIIFLYLSGRDQVPHYDVILFD